MRIKYFKIITSFSILLFMSCSVNDDVLEEEINIDVTAKVDGATASISAKTIKTKPGTFKINKPDTLYVTTHKSDTLKLDEGTMVDPNTRRRVGKGGLIAINEDKIKN